MRRLRISGLAVWRVQHAKSEDRLTVLLHLEGGHRPKTDIKRVYDKKSGAELCRIVKPGESCQDMLDSPDLGGVIYLRTLDLLDPSADGSSEREMCADVLKLAQALARRKGPSPQLFLVTRGAQGPGDEVRPAPATLWGFARTIRLEHPERNRRVVRAPYRSRGLLR